jgi:hypothetical protein
MTQSSDWAQCAFEEVFKDLLIKSIECFIDDIGAFTPKTDPTPWKSHLQLLDTVLTRLEKNGYTVNPQKCHGAVQEAPWLGHWMTPNGIKPLPNKIAGILQIAKPTTLCQLCGFIGMVNHYRNFWKRRSHLMASLTSLTKIAPKTFHRSWTKIHSDCFTKIKAMIAQQVLLAYPDPNKSFDIETDASAYQLGAVIYQDRKPITFFLASLIPLSNGIPLVTKKPSVFLKSSKNIVLSSTALRSISKQIIIISSNMT